MISGSVPSSRIRVTNVERHDTVQRLGRALTDGSLNVSEFDDRATRALAAATRGDLSCLIEDLPPGWQVPALTMTQEKAGRAHPVVRALTTSWLVASVASIAMWVALGIGHGDLGHLWWIWVVGPTGAVLTTLWYFCDRRR